jgi:hypothetical protein
MTACEGHLVIPDPGFSEAPEIHEGPTIVLAVPFESRDSAWEPQRSTEDGKMSTSDLADDHTPSGTGYAVGRDVPRPRRASTRNPRRLAPHLPVGPARIELATSAAAGQAGGWRGSGTAPRTWHKQPDFWAS